MELRGGGHPVDVLAPRCQRPLLWHCRLRDVDVENSLRSAFHRFWVGGGGIIYYVRTIANSKIVVDKNHVNLYRNFSGDSKMFHGQGEKTECGVVTADGRRAVCGYSDGSVRLVQSGFMRYFRLPKSSGFRIYIKSFV